MRAKRRPAGLWAACMFALMPPVYLRCSTPDDPPAPASRTAQLSDALGRRPLAELRELVTAHAELGARGEEPEGRPQAEPAYHEAIGRALGRLREAARAAAGPCAAGRVAGDEVASLDALVASLGDELDRHLGWSEAGDGAPDDEEKRHGAEALGLLDELDRAYADVERGARRRASVGCLWNGDVLKPTALTRVRCRAPGRLPALARRPKSSACLPASTAALRTVPKRGRARTAARRR